MIRGKKTDSRIKLTDKYIRDSLNSRLTKVKSSIRDSEIIGFMIIRSSETVLSFKYDYRLNGKRTSIVLGRFPTITTAQARVIAKEKALAIATGKDPHTDKRAKRADSQNTLKSYLQHDYGLYMRGRAIQAEKYLKIIENGFPTLLKKPLSDITKTDLVKWVQRQTEQHNQHVKGYASATIIQRHSTLKSLMSHAVRNGVINSNPFDRMDKLEFHKDESTNQQAKRTYLTLEQQQAFLQSVEKYKGSYHKPMMLILYYMGMRMGDVVSLEWTHVVDTPFTCNISKVLEKNRRKVKNPTVIPMPEPVRAVLNAWRIEQGNPANGLVFPAVDGSRLSKQPLRTCWKWIKKDAGFHEDLELYTLRHNFISWLIMNNVPLPVIAGMVGHSSTDMINRNYGHLIKGATTEASNGFADLLQDVG